VGVHRISVHHLGVSCRAYKVHVEEEAGARWWISVAAALGPNDAKHQAIEKAIDQGYLAVTALEVVSLDVRTA
jgi:hypothetical protein